MVSNSTATIVVILFSHPCLQVERSLRAELEMAGTEYKNLQMDLDAAHNNAKDLQNTIKKFRTKVKWIMWWSQGLSTENCELCQQSSENSSR